MATGRIPINGTAAIQSTIVDAKGDLIAGTGADAVSRLAVGANGTTLVADSAEATGLKWAAASSGGMTLISETVASSLTGLQFTGLGSYKQLLLCWSGVKHSTSGTSFVVRFNADSGSNYKTQQIWYGGGFDVSTGNLTSVNNSGMPAFGTNVTSASQQDHANGWLIIDNYASSTKNKTYYLFNLFNNASDGAGVARGGTTIGFYNSTSAITTVDIVRTAGTATFSNDGNTTIRLYGIS